MRERKEGKLPPAQQLLLSDKEVAALLGIGISTVWKKALEDDNFPKPFPITERARRWRRHDIMRWVKDLGKLPQTA